MRSQNAEFPGSHLAPFALAYKTMEIEYLDGAT